MPSPINYGQYGDALTPLDKRNLYNKARRRVYASRKPSTDEADGSLKTSLSDLRKDTDFYRGVAKEQLAKSSKYRTNMAKSED